MCYITFRTKEEGNLKNVSWSQVQVNNTSDFSDSAEFVFCIMKGDMTYDDA